MSTTAEHFDGHDGHDDEIARGLAALEQHLAEQSALAADRPVAAAPGRTRRVRALRDEVDEAHQLLDLQADEAPLLVDTQRVRRRQKRANEAARLHALGQNPAAQAWRDARVRRWLVGIGLVSLVLALSWSTAGVQAFAAEGAAAWSPGWVFAWLVEPFCSLALLMVVGARAYLGTRGQPLVDRTLDKIEWLFLGLTLGMNAWRHLPFVAERFSVSGLVLHLLGPVIAVAVVRALPIILAAFTGLGYGRPGTGATGPSYRENTSGEYGDGRPGTGSEIAVLVARVRRLIAAGELPADPGAGRVRAALRCGMDTARRVRDELRRAA